MCELLYAVVTNSMKLNNNIRVAIKLLEIHIFIIYCQLTNISRVPIVYAMLFQLHNLYYKPVSSKKIHNFSPLLILWFYYL